MATDRWQAMLVHRPPSLTTRVVALATIGRTEKIPGAAAAGGLANPFDDVDRGSISGKERLGLLRSAAGAITTLAGRAFRRPLERNSIPVAAVEWRTTAMTDISVVVKKVNEFLATLESQVEKTNGEAKTDRELRQKADAEA